MLWKKFEPLWDLVIRARQLPVMTPLLEGVLSRVTAVESGQALVSSTGTTGRASARPPARIAGAAEAFGCRLRLEGNKENGPKSQDLGPFGKSLD